MKIGFIGGGAMGEAIIKCLLSKKVAAPEDIAVSDISVVRRELLNKEYNVSTSDDNRKTVKNTDSIK